MIFAEVNKAALPFLQVATQAPHPMHAAESKASSAVWWVTGIAVASGAWPVFTETNPPEDIILSKADRSTFKSFFTGKASARNGSIKIVSPSLKDLR